MSLQQLQQGWEVEAEAGDKMYHTSIEHNVCLFSIIIQQQEALLKAWVDKAIQ